MIFIGVALGAEKEDGLSHGSDPEWEWRAGFSPIDTCLALLVRLNGGVLADKRLVLASGRIGVVEEVELADEVIRSSVLVIVSGCITRERVYGYRRSNNGCSTDVSSRTTDGVYQRSLLMFG